MQWRTMVRTLLVVLAALVLAVGGCANEEASGPDDAPALLKVVTTTTQLADIAQEVGAGRVEVVNIIPPASCPGHFDVKPADMQVLSDARIFFVHAWQGELFTDDLIRSADNADLRKVVADVPGNWMAPPVRSSAVDCVAAALAAADPENAALYEQNAAALKEEAAAVGAALKERLEAAGVGSVKVLADEMQAGFVNWAGFEVVATFGRPEDTSPKDLEQLLAQGREAGVALVVDNLQSGHETGRGLARELGAAQVTLSNFPGGFAGTDRWAQALERNVDLLLEACADL